MHLTIYDRIGVEFINSTAGLSIYFQPGDDANQFRDEVDQYTRAFGDERGLAELWEVYSTLFNV